MTPRTRILIAVACVLLFWVPDPIWRYVLVFIAGMQIADIRLMLVRR